MVSHTVVCHTVVCHTVWCVTHCGVSHTVVWCGVSHRAKMRICSVVRLLITMRIAQNTTESLISAVYVTCIDKWRIAAVCCGCGVVVVWHVWIVVVSHRAGRWIFAHPVV